MEIPTFPESIGLRLDHKHTIDMRHRILKLNTSHMQCSNLFVLDDSNTTQLSILNDNLIISFQIDDMKQPYIYVLGERISPTEMAQLGTYFERIELWPWPTPRAHLDNDNADYMYDISQHLQLYGSPYAPIRRKLNAFNKHYQGELKTVPPEKYPQLWNVFDIWEQDKNDTDKERAALEKALMFIDQLEITIDGLYVDNSLIGYAITESITTDTLLIHFFKALHTYKGSSEYLFYQLAKKYQSNHTTINFEQDLGINGLKQFKRNLQPSEIRPVYTIHLREESLINS